MSENNIYCDWAATAPFDEEIINQALQISLKYSGNPSSVHQKGIDAKSALQKARLRAAKALNVSESSIIFTSGGTESDYLPMLSLLQRPVKGSIVVTSLEHPAIREQAEMMKNCGWEVIQAQSDENGIVNAKSIVSKLRDDTALVCVMAVNNETGAIMPIYEISDAITEFSKGKKRPKFHVDAVQAAGKIPLNLGYSGIDTAAISAHKIGGPRGCGILYMKNRQEPFIRGGGQENGIRSGTENLFGAEAISLCLEKYFLTDKSDLTKFNQQVKYTSLLISEIKKIPGALLIPQTRLEIDNRFSPWVVQAAFENVPGEVMVRALSSKGIYISTGSACSAKKMSRPILEAMHISKDVAMRGVRFSFGYGTKESDITSLIEAIKEVAALMK